MKYVRLAGSFVGAVIAAASAAPAAFVEPSAWRRPVAPAEAAMTRTTYQEWDVFFSSAGPNAPDVAEINPNGVPDAFDAAWQTSGSFVTSGGNLYSFAGVIQPRVQVPLPPSSARTATEVLLQVRTFGALIDTDHLTVNGVPASQLGAYRYEERSRVEISGGFGGFDVEHAWQFSVSASELLRIDFAWGVSSSSLDRLAVDTRSMVRRTPVRIEAAIAPGPTDFFESPAVQTLRTVSAPEPAAMAVLPLIVWFGRRARRAGRRI